MKWWKMLNLWIVTVITADGNKLNEISRLHLYTHFIYPLHIGTAVVEKWSNTTFLIESRFFTYNFTFFKQLFVEYEQRIYVYVFIM